MPALLVAAALAHPLAVLAARWNRWIDLLTHFQEPALAVTIVASVVILEAALSGSY